MDRTHVTRTTSQLRQDLGIAAALAAFPLVAAGLGAMLSPDFAVSVDDAVSTLQPNTSAVFRQLAAGTLPFWSHHTLCGMPLYAGGQMLHPGSIAGHLIGQCLGVEHRSVAIAYLLYLALGTACAWFYLRHHGCGRAAAIVGSLAFCCSGPFWGFWTNWNPYGWAAAMIPPTFLAIDVALAHRGSLREGWLPACGLGMVLAVILTIADPQLIVKTGLLAGGYTLLRADRRAWHTWLPVLLAGAAMAACCGLAQCLAVRHFVSQTTRVSQQGVDFQDFFFMSLPPTGLLGLADPFLRRPWHAFGGSIFHGAAITVGPLLPVVAGMFCMRRWWAGNVPRALTVLFVIALLLSLGHFFPPNWLLRYVPLINNFRWPLRWTLEACTVGALVVGLAVDGMIRQLDRAEAERAEAWRMCVRCITVFGCLWAVRMLVPQAGDEGITSASLGWFVGGASLLSLAAATALDLGRSGRSRMFRVVAVVVAAAGGLLAIPEAQQQRFSDPDLRNLAGAPLSVSVGPYERVWPCLPMQTQRSLVQGGNLVYGLPLQFDTRSVSGYCFPLAWQAWRPFMGLQGQIVDFDGFRAAVLDPRRKGLLGLLRVGALVIDAEDAESRALLDRHPDFSPQSATEELLVYSHHGFRDAAWFVEEAQLVPPQPVELHRIDTARQAVVFVPGLRSATLKRFSPGNRVVSFAETDGKIDIEVECPAGGVLVVNTSFFPGWQASIDGSTAGVFMVDGGFMGLELPGGARTVRLRFAPAWLTTLFLFSTAAWVALTTVFVACVLPWLCRGGRPAPMTEKA